MSVTGLVPGQIVRSVAGHDKGDIFFVIKNIDDDYVLVADGDLRRIEKPKKKNVRHLQPFNKVNKVIAEKISAGVPIENFQLRKELERSGAVSLSIANQEETGNNG
ncbi:MAG: KOW domain-containing RNA-binding protein [Firmicutes bacterium]|nr:KOW domain-containing RNA-binding protein [Bacillota bacterium]